MMQNPLTPGLLLFSQAVLLLAAAQQNYSYNDLQIEAIQAHFQQAGIIPPLLPSLNPLAWINVSFPGVGSVSPGQVLSLDQVRQLPSIAVTFANESALAAFNNTNTTVILEDVGWPGFNFSLGQTRTWLVYNAVLTPGADGCSQCNSSDPAILNTAGGTTVTDYDPIAVFGNGSHRYALLLFRQNENFKPLITHISNPVDFTLASFLNDTHLTPSDLYAAFNFDLQNGTATASAAPTSSVITSTLPAHAASTLSPTYSTWLSSPSSGSFGSAQPTQSGGGSGGSSGSGTGGAVGVLEISRVLMGLPAGVVDLALYCTMLHPFAVVLIITIQLWLASAQDNYTYADLQIEAIQAHLKQAGIIPPLLSTIDPIAYLNVSFPDVGQISPGQQLTLDLLTYLIASAEVAQVPSINISFRNASALSWATEAKAMVIMDNVGFSGFNFTQFDGEVLSWNVYDAVVAGADGDFIFLISALRQLEGKTDGIKLLGCSPNCSSQDPWQLSFANAMTAVPWKPFQYRSVVLLLKQSPDFQYHTPPESSAYAFNLASFLDSNPVDVPYVTSPHFRGQKVYMRQAFYFDVVNGTSNVSSSPAPTSPVITSTLPAHAASTLYPTIPTYSYSGTSASASNGPTASSRSHLLPMTGLGKPLAFFGDPLKIPARDA
ncbi:hypothetical protein GLOTRDRAFT_91885 [Gloeophyllum trabeum ATCC 11539]|uniref:PEBP-like protein n=1 Tax=Gloeophyllum trabeum (strain ATCC 11539 / FP-39264 / Madison 617) TaxID=670483 RepID=S7QH04_GLOTA|nr:uncharacterized protein GLOTRDRAFT_91885 [Gloeophyllum trabeum ATCC 11539]EPQ58488.1 hypothetical protein GLOTRDRAFT_91885 [Gloeophyllum trabeum ATCC 11539]